MAIKPEEPQSGKKVVRRVKSKPVAPNVNNNVKPVPKPAKPDLRSRPPPKVSKWVKIGKFFYNDKTNAIMGRTPLSWFQIILFYTCFYAFLAGYWAACYYCLVELFIKPDQPSYILEESLISGFGTNHVKPGVSIAPRDFLTHDGHKLIFHLNEKWNNSDDLNGSVNNLPYAHAIQAFFDDHKNGSESDTFCADDSANRVCAFDYTTLGPCASYPFGYALDNEPNIKPCVYLKINRILKFKPEPYELDDQGKVSHPLPWVNTSSLEEAIRSEPNKVYLECHAKHNETVQALIEDSLQFFPSDGGIPFKYFPFVRGGLNSTARQPSPLVALQIDAKYFPYNEEVGIECFPFYKNVVHDRKTLQGLVRFSIRIDKD